MTASYTVTVTDGNGQQHQLVGSVEAPTFQEVTTEALRETFEHLTNGGDTVYGHPGQASCRGPYRVTKIELSRGDTTNG